MSDGNETNDPAPVSDGNETNDPAVTSGEEREIVQRGLWFDEFEIGVRYLHRPGRTINEADNVLFSTTTMNPQGLHLDAAESAAGEFGQRLVNSLLTMSVLIGQSVAHLTRGTIVANLGFTDISFPHPVFHGDTIYGETEVLDKRLSASRPGQGVVRFRHVARNQNTDHVVSMVRTSLIKCRPGS